MKINLEKRQWEMTIYDLKQETDPYGLIGISFRELIDLMNSPQRMANIILDTFKNRDLKQQRRNEYLKQLILKDRRGIKQ